MFFLDALAYMLSIIHGSLNDSLSTFDDVNITKPIGFEFFSLFL
ncbi:hypothetical protein PMIT1313_01322 [Prochlorococcus marinus str. MIT 1313]|nr:hypothetical protein PMIT1313_01322 [Prochlorococcus marinus str. MIT 1313]KZR72418.1 hypothetical protein PMIT1318_00932 [Prochlorococcus marinus str. MIT 1318]